MNQENKDKLTTEAFVKREVKDLRKDLARTVATKEDIAEMPKKRI